MKHLLNTLLSHRRIFICLWTAKMSLPIGKGKLSRGIRSTPCKASSPFPMRARLRLCWVPVRSGGSALRSVRHGENSSPGYPVPAVGMCCCAVRSTGLRMTRCKAAVSHGR